MKDRRLGELIQKYVLGSISTEEADELQSRLSDENATEARRLFRATLRTDSYLQEAALETERQREVESTKRTWLLPLALTGMVAALGFSVFAWFHQPDSQAAKIALVIRIDGNCDWVEGKFLKRGEQVEIQEGLLELAFRDSGVHLLGTAPLDFTIENNDRIFLREGEIKLHVPPQGVGFVVETPERKITDLGTSFVVKARSNEARILVLDGLVAVADHDGGDERLMSEGQVADFSPDREVEHQRRHQGIVPELSTTLRPGKTSLKGRIFGFGPGDQPFPNLAYREDWIGRQLFPLVESKFQDESSLSGLREGERLRFSGIAGAYNSFPDQAGLTPFNRAAGWLSWFGGKVTPPKAGRYRFWGYADNHLLVAIDGHPVFDGSRFDSIFHQSLRVARSNHPSFPCLNAPAGLATCPWIELDGNPVRIDILFGEVTGTPTSGLLLVEREGEAYSKSYWGQPKWPLFLTEIPTKTEVGELVQLRQHLEDKLMGSFSIEETATWKVNTSQSK